MNATTAQLGSDETPHLVAEAKKPLSTLKGWAMFAAGFYGLFFSVIAFLVAVVLLLATFVFLFDGSVVGTVLMFTGSGLACLAGLGFLHLVGWVVDRTS